AILCIVCNGPGEIGLFVRSVEVMDDHGEVQVRERDELRFANGESNLDDPVLLAAEIELDSDRPDAIVKRMRKDWIQRKAGQPFTFQAHGRMFKNPRGVDAASLIGQAEFARTRVAGAWVSEPHANSVVVHTGGTAQDVLRLLDLIRSRVRERFGVELELEMTVW